MQVDDLLSNEHERIPRAAHGIQVNFCKNPHCKNYGVPASSEPQRVGRGAGARRDKYRIGMNMGPVRPILRCQLCGESLPMKSNQGIFEELTRISAYIDKPCCPTVGCPNYGLSVEGNMELYQAFGSAKSGAKRYRCKACHVTFSSRRPGIPTKLHKKPHKNATVFRALVNKAPFRRICEMADISSPTLYNKIDFLHRQCLAFIAEREKHLLNRKASRAYVGVDRQEYTLNWPDRNDRRNSSLWAVGSADNVTGYVFGVHLNHDPSLDPQDIERNALGCGDYRVTQPFRKHARLWLREEYLESVKRSRGIVSDSTGSLPHDIGTRYSQALQRDDIETPDEFTGDFVLPPRGVQVHAAYTIYAHFLLLRRLQGRCDAFYVRINSTLSIDERRRVMRQTRQAFETVKGANPGLTDSQIKLMMLKESLAHVASFGKWQDKWVFHPFPNMSEPAKAMCYLTDTQGYDDDHKAWLYNKASLHSIDRFFMMARRRLQLLERPSTSGRPGQRFYIYSPYDPGVVAKLLDIFRVWYNYVFHVSKQTAAMRLGLAKGPVAYEDIIYYS
jgi:transposase-like protein